MTKRHRPPVCYCRTALRPDGTCPLRCDPALSPTNQKRLRKEERARRKAREEEGRLKNGSLPSREETQAADRKHRMGAYSGVNQWRNFRLFPPDRTRPFDDRGGGS